MRLKLAVGCVVLACAAWPGATHALQLRGDSGRDNVTGSARADVLRGYAGSDRLSGRGGGDLLFGGSGRDRLHGGAGNDTLRGGANGDRLVGGSGRDVLRGGSGPDAIRARDGRRDRIACGPGRDRATLDSHDVILDATYARPHGACEVVHQLLGHQPDASLVAVGDIARCPSGRAAITAALVDGLPGTDRGARRHRLRQGHAGRVRRAATSRPGGATRRAPGRRSATTSTGRPAPAGTSATSARPPASRARAGTATTSAPGTSWRSTATAARSVAARPGRRRSAGCAPTWPRTARSARVAYLHHPRFSSGNLHGGSPSVAAARAGAPGLRRRAAC